MARKRNGVKIVVIGGGSLYSAELIDGLIRNSELMPITNLTLVDIYSERLRIVGEMAQRMLDHAHYPLELVLTSDRSEALEGADFVISQIRVGGMSARLLDESVPPRYGVIGQETVGPGGIACALRTVPVMMQIADDITRICPDAWLLNFTNPAGVVTEALLKYSRIKTIGLCNIPTELRIGIAQICGVDFDDVELDYFGLNHLGWIRDVIVKGKSCMEEVLNTYISLSNEEPDPLFDARLLEMLEMIPTYYVSFYYNHPRMLADQLQGMKSRAERVMEIEQELLKLYADPATVEKPALLAERGGRHYSTVAIRLMAAIYNNSGETQILDVPNQGTFTNLPPTAIIEVPCRVDSQGAHPLPAAPMPGYVSGLVAAVKASEQLTVDAALTGDERSALRALAAHPLVPSFAVARSLLAALLAENIDYLPQFMFETLEQV